MINIYPADIFLYLLFVRKDALEQIVMHSYQKSLSIIASKLLKFDHYYFFLIKLEDAKNHSWDEIRAKKLYKKWITVKKENGEFDTNIKYSE